MNVFELFATLGLDSSSYEEGLESAEAKGSSFGNTLGTVVAGGAAIATTAIAATTAATVAGVSAFAEGITEVAAYGDEIDKTSQKLGLSTQAYQEWDYVLNIAGTSMSNMTTGVKTLTNKIDDAKNGSEDAVAMFEALGISMEDLDTMSREELFEQAIYGFQNMADSTERAALANDLFGRSGQELAPLFNMTEEETRQLIETANEYGMVMSEDAVSASAGFQDSLTTLEGTMNGLKNNLLSEFLPSISTVMDGLSAIFAGNDEEGLAAVDQGVNDFIDNLNDVLPRVMEIGSRILTSLISAISKNLPTLLSSAMDVMSELFTGLVQALPYIADAAVLILDKITSVLLDTTAAGQLAQTAVDIIVKLGTAIASALPNLIPAVVQVMKTIVETLTTAENLAMIMDVALEILSAFDQSIVQIAPEITSMIIPLLWNIIQAVITEAPDLIAYLFEHIVYTLASFWGTILGVFGVGFDDIKAYFELFNIDIFNIAESIAVNGILWFEGAWEFITTWFGNALTGIGEFVADIIEAIVTFGQNAISNITSWATGVYTWVSNFNQNILNSITGFFSNALSFFSTGINNIKSKVTEGLDGVKTTFTDIFEDIKTNVQNALEFLKSLFNFDWKLPDIKLPHFSVSGEFNLDPTNFSVPSIKVDWYDKAMNTPYMLDSATIFGSAGGKLLGAGESGKEVVYGHEQLLSDIAAVVDSRLSNMQFVVPVYIGGKKIDQQIVMSNARNAVVSGGR